MIRFYCILCFISLFFTCLSNNSDAIILSKKTNIKLTKGGLIKELSCEIKINNRYGEKYAKIKIPYSDMDKISHIEAFIKDSNGQIVRKLKKNEITTKSSISDISFFEDDYEKEFTIKHNSYPYTIVYTYQLQQKEFLHIDYWTPVVYLNIPTLSSSLTISVPKDFKISYLNQGITEHKIDTLNNRILYQWTSSYLDVLKPEIYSPTIEELIPSVSIIPVEFKYGKKGSFSDWVSYGNWQLQLLFRLNELPHSERIKIQTLTKDITDNEEKIKVLYHYLQDETRYINIKLKTGGLKPFPASYVAQNKFGDCKALTNYFKSMLDFLEIPSYYTKVYAGNQIKEINKDFPSQQFNHAILFIPLKDQDIWLDCTSDAAFNYLGTFTQNRDALIIDYNNSKFLKTPTLQAKDVLVSRKIDISYNHENAQVNFHTIYKGDMYESIIYVEKNLNKSERTGYITNYVVPNGFELLNYQILNTNRDSVQIEFVAKTTSKNIFKKYNGEILIKTIPFSVPNFEKPENRKLPVQIDYPIFKSDTLIYEKPIGYNLHISQNNYSIKNKYGEYQYTIEENTDKILIIKSLLINSGLYLLSEYEAFYTFCKEIDEMEKKIQLSLYK